MSKYIRVISGNYPLIITVPHGGFLKPKNIPDRKTGVHGSDKNTIETALEIKKAFARIGLKPYFVILNISRDKVDANRPLSEAIECGAAKQIYLEYHNAIQNQINEVKRRFGDAFIVDFHGQSHHGNRIELGYCVSRDQLFKLKEGVDFASSILHCGKKGTGFELIFGEKSLGEILSEAGYPTIPRLNKAPKLREPYFSGGYTTRKYAFERGVRGLQIELNYEGVRDTENNRAEFAKIFAPMIVKYLESLEIDDSEHVNFVGYGSLMSHTSLSSSIKDKNYTPVRIKGYKRIFNLVVGTTRAPDVLNVAKSKGYTINGVLFTVDRNEYAKLMSRERHYRAEKVIAYDYLTGHKMGKSVLVCDHFLDIDNIGMLPDLDYFKECRAAAYAIGREFGREWDETTYTSFGEKISKFIKRHPKYSDEKITQ